MQQDKNTMPIIRKTLYKAFSMASQSLGRLPTKEETFDFYTQECKKSFDKEFDLMQKDILSKSMGVIPVETRICRDCGTVFGLDSGEVRYYEEHNLHLPTRCKVCRENRRKGSKNE